MKKFINDNHVIYLINNNATSTIGHSFLINEYVELNNKTLFIIYNSSSDGTIELWSYDKIYGVTYDSIFFDTLLI